MVDVDLRVHADYILDAMARLVSSLIITELSLYRAVTKGATKAYRNGWLRWAPGESGAALSLMAASAGTRPALPPEAP